VPIGDAETAKQGQRLCVFGYPAQYDGEMNTALKDLTTMTIGYHSGWDYVFNKDYGFIKTDASINGGNSGGPAFGESNRVIGIASAKGTKTNIGLVGGINGMYYVAAPKSDVLKNLITRGLKVPNRAGAIATITGEKRPLPDVKQWQANKRGGNNNDNNTRRTNTGGSSDNSALTITGTVISVDSGSPLSGATIALLLPKIDNPKTMDDYEVLSAAKSGNDGTFSMAPTIKAGTYVFVAVSDGYESIVSKLEVAANNKSFNVKMARSR
ncbi:MAG: trypsin-like peptidase domain-containing protein, partial [Verrucomicrobia bacterium]|nr:trypsin-like peptidase domain-containing protein [Cytophagales bacterium]